MSSYYGSEIEEWFTDVVDCWRARCHDLERQLANVEAFGQAPCGCRRGIFDYDLCLQHHTAIRSQAERYPRWDADRCAVPWEAARAVQRFLEWCGDVE